ncbi:hypothetical protein [Streptomyces sp. CRN 30]|uniref:hypothetical protein n=1 Tax=Streptomyces sp. CRN 30 TaxID=3075613 RepID=UPI002A8181DD|nr:hypothetical protein [Streptomyces sp. CRN 30]
MDSGGGKPPHQDMERGSVVEGTAVEFVYRPTVADFEEALRGRARRSPAGLVQVFLAPLVAATAVLVFSVLRDDALPVFRDYLETPGLFVLLGGDRAAGVAVLPKRGARDTADVDRLRAILNRNLKRLQTTPEPGHRPGSEA